MSSFVEKLSRFGVIGVLNTALTFGVYSVFIVLGYPYQFSLVLSAIVGILFSSLLNKSITFAGAGWRYLAAFMCVYVVTVGLNITLVGVLVEKLYLNPILSQAIIVLPIAALTFGVLWIVDRIFKFKRGQS